MIELRVINGRVIPQMTIRAVATLCMLVMTVSCSSGRDSSTRPVAEGVSGQAVVSNDDPPCLTPEQKAAKMKELKEKDSWVKNEVEYSIVRGGGNLLGSLIGLDDLGEHADRANDVRKMTVKGNIARDSIDTVLAKDCESVVPPTTNNAPVAK